MEDQTGQHMAFYSLSHWREVPIYHVLAQLEVEKVAVYHFHQNEFLISVLFSSRDY